MNSNPALARIHAEVTANNLVLYLRGAPAFPLCGGSAAIVQILEHMSLRYRAVDVVADPGINAALRQYADWPTVPQLYIRGEFIGGADIVGELYGSGELHDLLRGHALLPEGGGS